MAMFGGFFGGRNGAKQNTGGVQARTPDLLISTFHVNLTNLGNSLKGLQAPGLPSDQKHIMEMDWKGVLGGGDFTGGLLRRFSDLQKIDIILKDMTNLSNVNNLSPAQQGDAMSALKKLKREIDNIIKPNLDSMTAIREKMSSNAVEYGRANVVMKLALRQYCEAVSSVKQYVDMLYGTLEHVGNASYGLAA